jgi:hypothetical protein
MDSLLFFFSSYSSCPRGKAHETSIGFKSKGGDSDRYAIQPVISLGKIFSLTDSGLERYFLKAG